jgi:hypothetical protein
MANEVATTRTQATGFSLIPKTMDEAFKIADMMVRSKSMPEHLRTAGDALMVVEQAGRWEMSPFAVAQCSFSYKGRLGYEGKLIQAVIEGSPMARRIVSSLMDYQFEGEGDNLTITASATRVGEAEPRTVTVKLKDARTDNAHWKKSPHQMLCYHAARVWARRWAPSIILGVYSADELQTGADREESAGIIEGEVEDVTDRPERHTRGTSALREEINEEITIEPPEPVSTAPAPAKRRTVREIVRDHLVGCSNTDDVAAVAELPLVAKALKEAPADIREELTAMLGEAYARVQEEDLGAANEPEPADDAIPA